MFPRLGSRKREEPVPVPSCSEEKEATQVFEGYKKCRVSPQELCILSCLKETQPAQGFCWLTETQVMFIISPLVWDSLMFRKILKQGVVAY